RRGSPTRATRTTSGCRSTRCDACSARARRGPRRGRRRPAPARLSPPHSRQDNGGGEGGPVAAAGARAGGPRGAPGGGLRRVGARHAVAVSSGTAALHVAYRAAGVGSGDVVLTSPLTFVATANAAIHCGGRPRFADVDARGALDPRAVAEAVARHGMPRVVV